MNATYGLLLVLHILATIAVIGTAFIVPVIRKSARTTRQLLFSFVIASKLAIWFKIGGTVLIITGVWLMLITNMGFTQTWLTISILLSLLMIVTINVLIEPRMKKIKRMVTESYGQEEDIHPDCIRAIKKVAPFELTAQLLMIVILILMVIKPS